MASPVTICNWALGHLGNGKQIGELAERSFAAEQCQLYYDAARSRTLRQFDWPFARAYGYLTQVEGVEPLRPFTTVYDMPACVAFRQIERPAGVVARVPFKITSKDGGGRLIHTSQGLARGIWTIDQEDPEQFDEGFANAMAWSLAVDLAMPITKSKSTTQAMYEMFLKQKAEAEFESANEEPDRLPGHDDAAYDAPWIAARGE